ncbi:MAG: hypothetical protein GX316_01340 [Firmicutes bacterium]|mgnify:FL=1|nr:hypothetical protein [Bacillota bacterium]
MRKVASILLVGLLIIGLFGAVVFAEVAAPDLPRDPEVRAEKVRALDGEAENALVFRIKGGFDQDCNITPRHQTVETRAFVAQWAKWSMNYKGWEWYVKKPGEYYGNCITGTLQSNGPVTLEFKFSDLEGGNSETNNKIATAYSYTTCSGDPEVWYEGEFGATIPDDFALHAGFEWSLWNKIKVVECNSPGLYSAEGTITLTLDNQANWIDAEGDFDMAGWFTTENGYLQTEYN